MSELSEKISEFQKKTGESVLESKKYIDLAGGDLDLAIEIYLEEKTKSEPAPQPVSQQAPVQPQPIPQSDSDMETMAKEKTVANTVKLLTVSGYLAFVFAGLFLAVAVVFFLMMGLKSYSVACCLFLAVASGAMIWTGVVSLQRAKRIDFLTQECNVSKYVAWQALIINKWHYEPALEMLKAKNKEQ